MKKINRCDIFVFITLLMCACAHKSGHGERVMISSNYKNEGVQKENGQTVLKYVFTHNKPLFGSCL